MKYLNKKFSSKPANENYRDGWDKIFGNKEEKTKMKSLTPDESSVFTQLATSSSAVQAKTIASKLEWFHNNHEAGKKNPDANRVLRALFKLRDKNMVTENKTGIGSRWKLKV